MFLSFEYIMWKIIFAILFTLYPVWHDHLLWNCPSSFGKVIIFIHHIVCTMLFFLGPLFGYHYLHNILIVTASLSWIILGRCFYTMYQNYVCGYKDARFLNMANITRDYIEKKTGIKIHFMYELIVLAIILVYNLYMIYQSPIRMK